MNRRMLRLLAAAMGAALVVLVAPPRAIGDAPAAPANSTVAAPNAPTRDRAVLIQRVKQWQQRMLMEEGRAEMRERQERAAELRRALHRHGRKSRQGAHMRPVRNPEVTPVRSGQAGLWQSPEPAMIAGSLGPNLLVNDTTGDRADAVGQSEPSVASWNNYVVIGWNEGRGFVGNNGQLLGYAYSTDGGVTFHKGNYPPLPPGGLWTSDPVFTVNEKTGEFFFAGLTEPNGTTNGVGVARLTFTGSTPHWDTAKIVVSLPDGSNFADKPWLVADSSATGPELHLSYTQFTNSGDDIKYLHSTTAWNVWNTAINMNLGTVSGYVQGSRPAVDGDGNVYVVWKEIGLTDADFLRIRKSTDHGQTFSPTTNVANIYDNFGTGAPGFNRSRSITFPGIAIDRSHGVNRGRVYVTWNECINWYPSLNTVGSVGSAAESEPNDSPSTATPFTIGNTLTGVMTWTPACVSPCSPPAAAHGEVDFWKFPATQGQTYTFWADSIQSAIYSMRIICADDSLTRLDLAGNADNQTPDNTNGFIVWTCPHTGTYFLRMFNNIPGNTASSAYEILTGLNATSAPSPARDQRDVEVVSAADGLSFGAPHRPNLDPAGYDDWLPEVTVSPEGVLYAFWYGFGEAPANTCGGQSHVYLARSDDGGQTWKDVGRVSDALSPWTTVITNIEPNQGDYLGLYSNNLSVFTVWTDGRFGTPDILAVAIPLASTPTLVSLAGADATSDHVTVSWYSASSQVTEAYVYRMEGGAWVLKGVIDRDGSGKLTYVDHDVFPGIEYRYRLGVRSGGSEQYLGEVAVVVPSLQKLRLEPVRPNPADREIWVSFTLPRPGPARLQLIDVAGREVRSREVGSLGPGKHLLDLAAGSRLPAGVYIINLQQDGAAVTERVSVVR